MTNQQCKDKEKYTFIFNIFGLFSVLHQTKNFCIGYIVTVSLKGIGKQYTPLIDILNCKLLTNGQATSFVSWGKDEIQTHVSEVD